MPVRIRDLGGDSVRQPRCHARQIAGAGVHLPTLGLDVAGPPGGVGTGVAGDDSGGREAPAEFRGDHLGLHWKVGAAFPLPQRCLLASFAGVERTPARQDRDSFPDPIGVGASGDLQTPRQ